MKIALLSTPWIAVPPSGYGGIEKVIGDLTEGLVKRGHQVMLFATGDSKTSARLEYYYDKALGNNLNLKANPYYIFNHIHAFFKIIKKEKFDIIHNHNQYFPMYFFDLIDQPFVHTLHGAFYKNLKAPEGFIEEKRSLLMKFKNHPFISISNNQRTGIPELNYIKTVYNGINPQDFWLGKGEGGYLVWLGRITYNKGLDIAIRVARKVSLPLKIAAFIDKGEEDYFQKEIKPLIDKKVEFLGEIKDLKTKSTLFGNAKAFLFPIRWHEPFGIVMLEAMACGTPVIAFNKGSVAEVIIDGQTGFIVNTEEEMVKAIEKVDQIDRSFCREHVIKNFTTDKMVEDYLEAYQRVIKDFTKI